MATASLTLSPAEIAQIPSPSLPIGPQISHLLSEFTSLSIQLFTILSSPSSASTTALTTPIYLSLSSLDQKLSSLLSLLAQHQQKQSRINSLVSSLRTLDESWHFSASTLHSCISSLDPIISSGALDRSSISLASTSALTSESLLSYARLLAPFTSAPPSSLYPPHEKLRGIGATDPTGRSLPIGAIPPFPTEGVMRRGRLQFGRDEGLGTTNEIGARKEGQDLHGTPPPIGANEGGQGQDSTMNRLQYEAKQYENQQQNGLNGMVSNLNGNGGGEGGDSDEEEEEQFEFDLDLNPDL